ncbi:MAG: amidohydrolase family protein [Gammaproteobacteria bacterium]|nr:amidohydrolase family protein [Gammaproteobacteria bacterium]
MARTLIRGAQVVSVDPVLGVIDDCDILVEGESILEVRPGIDVASAEVIDAGRMIAMPGLINAHIHTWETMLRGLGASWDDGTYFDVLLGRIARHFQPEDIYIGTLMGALNQLDGGCTTILDWCHNTATPEHTDMAIRALEDSGIRAVFGHGTPKPNPEPGEAHFSTLPFPAAEARRLRCGRFADNDSGLVSLALCILGPDYGSLDVNRHDFALARELDLMTSAHVWGGGDWKTPGGYRTLVDEGLMDPRHNAVHANFFDDDLVRLLVDQGASITATPAIEVGVPKPPMIAGVIRAGGKPSIAIDTEIDVAGSMFDCMRSALSLHNAFDSMAAWDPDGAREQVGRPDIDSVPTAGDLWCTPIDALEWATINNARALGLESRTGSLTPGKQADILLVRRDDLNLLPAIDPVQTIVSHAHQGNVDTVLVGGRIMKRHGRLLADNHDLGRLGERLAESCRRIFIVADNMGFSLR